MKNTLPAGTYVICDPCYVIRDSEWDRVLQETEYFNYKSTDRGGVFTDSETGLEYAVFSTAYGDGLYVDNMGHKFPVDAGCIGCVPVGMCGAEAEGHLVVERKTPFEVEYNNGTIIFGAIRIDTKGHSGGGYYEDQEEEEEEED